MYTALLVVIQLVALTAAHEHWIQDNYRSNGISGQPGCQCSCDPLPVPLPATPTKGALGIGQRRRKKKNNKLREPVRSDVTRGSRDLAVDPVIPRPDEFPGRSRDIIDVKPRSRDVGVIDTPVIGEPQSPIFRNQGVRGQDGIFGGAPSRALLDRHRYGDGYDNGFVESGLDNGFNGNGLNEVNMISDVAGFAVMPNNRPQDGFSPDGFTNMGLGDQGPSPVYSRSGSNVRKKSYRY